MALACHGRSVDGLAFLSDRSQAWFDADDSSSDESGLAAEPNRREETETEWRGRDKGVRCAKKEAVA